MLPYKEGIPLHVIIVDGWARNLGIEQTIHEATLMGYDLSIEDLKSEWRRLDNEYSYYITTEFYNEE